MPTQSQTPSPTEVALRQAWQDGPHAETYDLGKGPNTYCARCHAPKNWDPAAKVDPPPNCVSCKFAFEAEPRVAISNPQVPEADWESIGCDVCHPVEAGTVLAELTWLDPVTGYHETVATATELCQRCHTNTETLRHQRDLGSDTHQGFTCVDCHDPHSAAASCTKAGCHAIESTPGASVPGHDAAHHNVKCDACHDATGLAVGPVEGQAIWAAFRTTQLLGRDNTSAYQSHNLQRPVACSRCHYPDNPWALSVSAEE
jgi:hypothetical protein